MCRDAAITENQLTVSQRYYKAQQMNRVGPSIQRCKNMRGVAAGQAAADLYDVRNRGERI
jgi:hypothetical protein